MAGVTGFQKTGGQCLHSLWILQQVLLPRERCDISRFIEVVSKVLQSGEADSD